MINAFKYTKQLEEAGFSRQQAELQLQIISEVVEGELATKQDLQINSEKLEHKMLEMEYRIIVKICSFLSVVVTIVIGVATAILAAI